MIAGQDQAWETLQKDGVQMEGPNPAQEQKPWTLKPDCLRFFIGVNQLALISPTRNTFAGHWRSEFGRKNVDAIDALLVAEVPPASQNDNDTLLKVKLIEELRNQIRSIKADKSYREVGAEPYKLAVRVLLLASLIGRVPCFNCKSGKDRTGVLDVEIKALVQTINENIARHGMDSETLVPQYNEVRSEEQKRVFKDLHLYGGSQEVSYANTGLVGNKTSVANYMGENLDEHTLKLVAGFGRHADGNKK
jgi:phosphatidylinositol-4,5-bisphosphate 4-phosphatase